MATVTNDHPVTQTPGDTLDDKALNHVWIHSQPWMELTEQEGLHVFERGEGCWLWDTRGNKYFDGISGLWVVNAGHGRTEIGDAMGRQAGKLAYVSASSFTNGPAAELAWKLAQITPGDLNRVFFSSGGSEAVETALKIAKQIQAMRGFPRRYKVIARRGSYHGMTHGAMSLTAQREEKYFGPFMYGVSYVPQPGTYRSDFGLTGEDADIMAAKYVEQEIISQGPETVACVIGEPISSAAGLQVPHKIYWQMLREICDRHGVLLICDEVINGFGRTGTMFATEQYGIVPDIMTMAKGLSSGYAPIAATVVRESIHDIFKEHKDVSMGHLLTFGGHAVAATAAIENLDIFERENLPEQSREKGDYLLGKLNELRDHVSVGDVRGRGLYCVLDLVSNKETKTPVDKGGPFLKRLNQELDKRGLLTRAWNYLHFAPPLVVSKDEIDQVVAIADESLTIAENAHPETFNA